MTTFNLALSVLGAVSPLPARPAPATGAAARARDLIADSSPGAEWCADDLVRLLKINRKTAHAILTRMAAGGAIEPCRTERVSEMRNTNRMRTYYRRKS